MHHTGSNMHTPPHFMIMPDWVPGAVRQYLAHTGMGMSIRDLARLSNCHASTVSRRIRKVEEKRDDPLVDAALRQIEAHLRPGPQHCIARKQKGFADMSQKKTDIKTAAGGSETFERDALRILRRLTEMGAVLAVAQDMETGVIVREGPDGSTARTATVTQDMAQALALKNWIEAKGAGRILRYSITSCGRDALQKLVTRFPDQVPECTPVGFAERRDPFRHAEPVSNDHIPEPMRRSRYATVESPLIALARRKDKSGTPFLEARLVRAGERLREDFELAQMNARQPGDAWLQALRDDLASVPGPEDKTHAEGSDAARARVLAALKDLGAGLGDVALRCCCYLEGLESAEKHMGWSARSGKIVLRIALQRLARHYEENLTGDAQLIG